MCKVADAAKVMINYSIEVAARNQDNQYLLNFYKLHKLLYLAQGYMLVHYNKQLFEEDIEAHTCGPYIPELHRLPINFDVITEKFLDSEICPITEDRKLAIKYVIERFGSKSKDELTSLSKGSAPYQACVSMITDEYKPPISWVSMQSARDFFDPDSYTS